MIEAASFSPGVYIWRDAFLLGYWHIYIAAAPGVKGPIEFTLRSNETIREFTGVDGNEVLRDDSLQGREDAFARFRIASTGLPRHIKFRTGFIGADLRITHRRQLPFFLGSTLKQVDDATISLRMPDPHAMSWINVLHDPHPELFLARGGNRGRLKPPFPAKRNRFFMGTGKSDKPFQLAKKAMVPLDYGRGRSVSWVDINADGMNELYLGNKMSSNALLHLNQRDGRYEDLASKFGLALYCGDAFTWMDLNNDGFDDLVFSTCYGSFAVALNQPGKSFSILNAEDFGIQLAGITRQDTLFESTTVNTFDFDSDGDLDLLVGGLGEHHALKVFRNDAGEFSDVSDALGLENIASERTIATDLNADGYMDLLTGGKQGISILLNNRGAAFYRADFSLLGEPTLPPGKVTAMAAADFNSDGVTDIIVGIKGHWWILLNRTRPTGTGRLVRMQRDDGFEPVGSVVRAHFSNGRVIAQRYGSAEMNGLSQFVSAMIFHAGHGEEIDYFSVRSPGSDRWQKVAATDPRITPPTPP
ncbi:MAG: VCBS repeat-containing protein [Thiohalobacterales bacterium]|nr:VCBS repeat-containing protein [Thiohalobacterales bacterium]